MVRISIGQEISVFFKRSGPAAGSNEPSIQCQPRSISPEVKRSAREADHSPRSSNEVNNEWSYTSNASMPSHLVDRLYFSPYCLFFLQFVGRFIYRFKATGQMYIVWDYNKCFSSVVGVKYLRNKNISTFSSHKSCNIHKTAKETNYVKYHKSRS